MVSVPEPGCDEPPGIAPEVGTVAAFVIVMEMTDNQAMLIPLMAPALLSAGLSRLINREPLYHALSHRFVSGPVRRKGRHPPRPAAPPGPVPD